MSFLIALAGSDITIGEAFGNMLVGFGIVFVTLIFLCGVISLFKYISKLDKTAAKAAKKAPVKAATPAPAPAAPKTPSGIGGEDPAVLAVILAAVAQHCGPNAVVTSVTRSK